MKRIKEEYVGALIDVYDPMPTPPAPTNTVTLYVAYSRNEDTKAGGWATIVVGADGQARSLTGSELDTTACRLEVIATVKALRTLQEPTLVHLVTDSEYLFRGVTEWLPNWMLRNFKNIQHRDVWEQAGELIGKHTIAKQQVRAPDSDPLKRQCQQLARSQAGQISYYD